MSNIIKPPSRFVGLHAHTQSSTFDGIGYPDKHIDFVLSNEMNAWALTDHGNGNGLAHAHHYAKKLDKEGRDYRQLYGVEFYFVPDLGEWQQQYDDHREAVRLEREEKKLKALAPAAKVNEVSGGHIIEDEEESKGNQDSDEWKRRYHLVVVAKNAQGLKNLFTLVKKSYKYGFYRFPRIDFKMLKEHSEGLVVSTACLAGPLASTSYREEEKGSSDEKIQGLLENLTDKFVDAVGQENFFLEIQFNSLGIQHVANRHIMSLSQKTGIPLIATADSHYCSPDMWLARELYRRLGRRYLQKEADTLPKFEDLKCELYPKNAMQMWDEYHTQRGDHTFYDDQLVADAIERTYDIAWDMCDQVWFDTSAKLPVFTTAKETSFQKLATLVKQGLIDNKLEGKIEYVERAKDELTIIKNKGFEDYFLTMYEVFDEAQKGTLLGPGRGSGGGSLVNYLLGLTQMDPIKYGLLMERFISEGRKGYPDIDSDAGDRDVLIDAARKIFGDESVIPVSNFNTLKLKSLIKDISKFYNIPFDEVNDLTNKIQEEVQPQAQRDDEENSTYMLTHEDCMKYSSQYREFVEKYPEIVETIKDLFMQNRSIGRHAGGVLICPDLEEHMPIIKVRGEFQTPWSEGMNFRHLEENGFLKFDFLGLALLAMVEKCIRLILKNQGNPDPSFADVKKFFDENLNCRYHDLDDKDVFKYVYHAGRFPGIFQFTQSGARQFCTVAQPNSVDELATITAIYRPGPLRANVHKKYVEAKKDIASITYDHELIEEVLKPTLGFITFQEQFMVLAQKLSGFSASESDQMRKTLVKKSLDSNEAKIQERVDLKKRFIEGAYKLNGIKPDIMEPLWEKIEYFSQYGFNKSHAMAYAIDSYYAAWLMTYYEKEWLATCLQTKLEMGPEKVAKMISEVKQLGHKVFPADINYSGEIWTHSKERKGFVAPLGSIKGVGESAVSEILENRPYYAVDDLLFDGDGKWKHSKLNKTCFTSLCKIEALGSLQELADGKIENHKQLLSIISENYSTLRKGRYGITKKQKEKLNKKGEIVDPIVESLIDKYQDLQDWSRQEKIDHSFDISSMVSNDLLFPGNILERINKSDTLPVTEFSGDMRGIGWFCILEVIKKKTKNGKAFLRLKVTDDENNIVWLRVWGSSGDGIRPYTIWIADVRSDPDWGCSTNAGRLRRLQAE